MSRTTDEKIGCGLISINVSIPSCNRVRTASRNRTGSRRFLTQYLASSRSPPSRAATTVE